MTIRGGGPWLPPAAGSTTESIRPAGPVPYPAAVPIAAGPPGDGPGENGPAENGGGRPRHAVTLRTKLIASTVGLVLLICGAVGIATGLYLNHYLTDQADSRIQEGLSHSGYGPFPGGGGPDACPGPGAGQAPWSNGPAGEKSLTAEIRAGRVVFAQVIDPFNGCVQLTDTAQQELLAAADSGHNTTIALDGLGEYRVGFQTAGDGTTFVSGVSMGRENATIARLALTLGIAITAGLVLAALVAYVIVRRSLRPLDEVAATARQVTTVQLHRGEVDLGIRVPERYTDPRTEVGQVGAALNSMLGHVSTALERRQASETQVRQFVADASHELRTPLAAIRGYTELARRDDTDQEAVSHALSRVDSESVRMSALVDDLLLLARLDAGRPLAGDEVDLTLLVMDVVSDARAAGPAHNWRLDLPEEPVSVVGDQSRLHQVIANLLTNARTHTPAGTTVTTGVAVHTDRVEVTVSDNGPGIDRNLLPGIFDRFIRGDSSRSRGAGSTGLGLAIVRAVVTAHHGTVTADSRPGRTTFTVRLPAFAHS